jgi:hypothetical protein
MGYHPKKEDRFQTKVIWVKIEKTPYGVLYLLCGHHLYIQRY